MMAASGEAVKSGPDAGFGLPTPVVEAVREWR